MASPRSSTLFHFTKTLEKVQSILQKGFIPYYSLEDTSWLRAPNAEFLAFPMACFCDIPISRIHNHVKFYGDYGIGISKDWALRNGVNPTAYYSLSSPLSDVVLTAIRAGISAKKKDSDSSLQDCIFSLLSYAKPITGTMIVAGEPVSKEFYLENEWRHVPSLTKAHYPVTRSEYENAAQRAELDKIAEAATIVFNPADIRYIFVKTDADIPPLINFMNDKLQHFPSVELKILSSRVTSLEYLARDV